MNILAMLLLSMPTQFDIGCPIDDCVYRMPIERHNLILGEIVEETRVYMYVNYPFGYERVPVINGFVPNVHKDIYINGDKTITYDYTPYRPVEKVMVWKPNRSPQKYSKKPLDGMLNPLDVKDPESKLVPSYRGNK